MNILPKKRWHVRTKENIARVRRDEARAAEAEKEKEERTKLAEREARLNLLRSKVRDHTKSVDYISLSSTAESTSSGHINFFSDLENGTAELKSLNKEHEKEKKDEKEKYEKQIGYLTYLGQDTNEALGKKNWYDVAPSRSTKEKEEMHIKSKLLYDPLNDMKKYLSVPIPEVEPSITLSYKSSTCRKNKQKRTHSDNSLEKSSHKSHKKHKKKHKHKKKKKSTESSDCEYTSDREAEKQKKENKLQLLRMQRLRREKDEKRKAEMLLAKYRGEPITEERPVKEPPVHQKYNSQFNPVLAKQNYTN